MNSLKIGISGVRGVVGETFTPELAVAFAQAFGTYLDAGRILVCRDARTPGTVVTNVSTSAAVDVIAARHGASVVRTPVG